MTSGFARASSIVMSLASRVFYFVALPALLVALWWWASAQSTSFFFPPLQKILIAMEPTWFSGRLVSDALPSIGRLLVGYLLAVSIGLAVGLPIGLSPRLRDFLEPVMEFFRAIPPPVLVPVLMLFLGIGFGMKVFVIAFGACWPVILNTVEGVRAVDEALRDVAQVYRFSRLTRLRSVILRGASPQIVTGARQALSIAIILMVISEMFAANNGLGYSVVSFQRSFAILEMWTGIILLGVLGMLLSVVFQIAERRLLKWYAGLRQTGKGI
jgi:ABC-type nitrate/sulfonate/bicarbonate transport system permease component